MEIKYVIPNMDKTFGKLEYAGEGEVYTQRVNGKVTTITRKYNLYSDIQRADDIVVELPASAGEKNFNYEDEVILINPKISAQGYKIGDRGFTKYILTADDMQKVEKGKGI